MQASSSGCEDYIADYIAREIISQSVNAEGHLHMFDKSEGGLKCMKLVLIIFIKHLYSECQMDHI